LTTPAAVWPSPRGRGAATGSAWNCSGWRQAGVEVLASALTADEQWELGLEDEPQACAAHGIEFVGLPIPDLGAPQDSLAFLGEVGRLTAALRLGRNVAVHCRQGVGRSGLVAVAVMVALGSPLEAALQAVSLARGLSVPETQEQRNWLEALSGALSRLEAK